MTAAETVNLYLVHGDPARLRLAEISNWSGKALAAPRTELKDLLRRPEMERTGVYLLIGQDSGTGRPEAYIGEGDNLAKRIRQHRARDFWNQAIAFINTSDSFTKAHARHLESELIVEAAKIGRYRLTNKVDSSVRLSEFDRAFTDSFYRRVKQLLPLLGSNLLSEVRNEASSIATAGLAYKVKKAHAFGDRTHTGFVVYRGSSAAGDERAAAAKHGAWTLELRRRLIGEGKLSRKKDVFVFTEDVEFASPSAAAAVVAGGPAAGPLAWKDNRGRTLKEIEAQVMGD